MQPVVAKSGKAQPGGVPKGPIYHTKFALSFSLWLSLVPRHGVEERAFGSALIQLQDNAIHIAETYGNKSTYGKPSNMGEYCECDSSNVCDLGKAAHVKSRLDFGGFRVTPPYHMSSYLQTLHTLAQAVEPVANQRIAACIVFKGKLVSFGVNQHKSHPFQKRFACNEHKIYLHAETAAVLNAMKHLDAGQLRRSTLYVARVKRPYSGSTDWVSGLAKPCAGCQHCLDAFGITNIVYSI